MNPGRALSGARTRTQPEMSPLRPPLSCSSPMQLPLRFVSLQSRRKALASCRRRRQLSGGDDGMSVHTEMNGEEGETSGGIASPLYVSVCVCVCRR
ncbi:hypothetical protein GH5_02853 [Leishmania sp. Ghana 2012 LV757]|uniref:hypothetical protein n=1 Tax=Leishmania sp. Ghana 2012 LV757 TaxID=2803181 RepID=UPI001B588D55|nr:hypothetical protein GH5_02853 [Leishmania sp. Ghana 2012 LV757]